MSLTRLSSPLIVLDLVEVLLCAVYDHFSDVNIGKYSGREVRITQEFMIASLAVNYLT